MISSSLGILPDTRPILGCPSATDLARFFIGITVPSVFTSSTQTNCLRSDYGPAAFITKQHRFAHLRPPYTRSGTVSASMDAAFRARRTFREHHVLRRWDCSPYGTDAQIARNSVRSPVRRKRVSSKMASGRFCRRVMRVISRRTSSPIRPK